MSWVRREIALAHRQIPDKIVSAEQFEAARAVYEKAEIIAKYKHPNIWTDNVSPLRKAFTDRTYLAYRVFTVTSRSGKLRQIREPIDGLKLVQSVLGRILHNVLHVQGHGGRPQSYLHGFVRDRSILSGAIHHFKKGYVVKMDIKNYFESITTDMLNKAFVAGSKVGYQFPDWLREALLAYGFYKPMGRPGSGFTALGSPSSPSIANAISAFLIIPPIMGVLKNSATATMSEPNFSMYADDMTFSSNDKSVIKLTRIVPMILRRIGLSVNQSKTKVLGRNACQLVCGVVVNKKPSTPRSYRRALRKNIHHITKQVQLGIIDPASVNVSVLRGRVSYVGSICSTQGELLDRQMDKLEAVL